MEETFPPNSKPQHGPRDTQETLEFVSYRFIESQQPISLQSAVFQLHLTCKRRKKDTPVPNN